MRYGTRKLFNQYSVVQTGNTKKLADAVYEILPKDKCDYFGENDSKIPPSDLLYIGFWTDKGSADTKTLELLAKTKKTRRFFCLERLGSVEVMYILKRSSDKSNNPLIQAMLLLESICAREKCHNLYVNDM